MAKAVKPGEYLRRSQVLLRKVEQMLGSGDAYKFKMGIAGTTGRKDTTRRAFMVLAYTNALMSDYLRGISEVAKPHRRESIALLHMNANVHYEVNSALASVKRPRFWERGKSAALDDAVAANYKMAGRTFGLLVRLLREHPELEKAHKERVTAAEMEKWKSREFREFWEKQAAAENEMKRRFLRHLERMAGRPEKKE